MNNYLKINYHPHPPIMKTVFDKYGKIEIETVDSIALSDSEDHYQVSFTTKPIYEYRFDKNLECILCSEKVKNDEKIRVLKCRHQFHLDCLNTWLTRYNQFCPTCRATNI